MMSNGIADTSGTEINNLKREWLKGSPAEIVTEGVRNW